MGQLRHTHGACVLVKTPQLELCAAQRHSACICDDLHARFIGLCWGLGHPSHVLGVARWLLHPPVTYMAASSSRGQAAVLLVLVCAALLPSGHAYTQPSEIAKLMALRAEMTRPERGMSKYLSTWKCPTHRTCPDEAQLGGPGSTPNEPYHFQPMEAATRAASTAATIRRGAT